MDKNLKRLLEHAGILRRNTPNNILFEGDDEDAGDDLFGDDSDDSGDDESGDGEGGDADGASEEAVREPPESLDAEDVEEFGSPRFKEFDSFLADAFQEAQASAYVGAQEHEAYPGEALPSTPAKEEEPEDADEEEKEANESLLSRRDKELIVEALFLLTEAGEEGVAPDEFDMEHFARQVQHLIKHHDTIADIEGSIFNMARQMILNNYGAETENEFVEFLARLDPEMDFTGQFEETIETPVAAGAIAGGGAA